MAMANPPAVVEIDDDAPDFNHAQSRVWINHAHLYCVRALMRAASRAGDDQIDARTVNTVGKLASVLHYIREIHPHNVFNLVYDAAIPHDEDAPHIAPPLCVVVRAALRDTFCAMLASTVWCLPTHTIPQKRKAFAALRRVFPKLRELCKHDGDLLWAHA